MADGDRKVSRCDLSVVGHLVTASKEIERCEVRIKGGKIQAVGPISNLPASQQIDVGNHLILPGLVDAHVHSLSHANEGVAAATRAAAAGGVTTIIEMPFDAEGPIWDRSRLESKRRLVEAEAVIDVALYATIRPGDGIKEIPDLVDGGVVAFKVSTFNTDPSRFPGLSTDYLLSVLTKVAETGLPVTIHCEDNELIQANLKFINGTHPSLHSESRPALAEYLAVSKVLELARWTGARVHIAHVSTSRAIEMIVAAAREETKATSETCPHYLTFTEQDLAARGAVLKINPPLRSAEEREKLWSLLADGKIDIISSDHAPWPKTLKTRANILDNHSGAPGVETMLPAVFTGAFERNVSRRALIKAMAQRPAQIFGISHRKGDIAPGFDADIVVVDPAQRWEIEEKTLSSNAGWSPYHKMQMIGRPLMTISKGRIVWDGAHAEGGPYGEVVNSS